MKAFTLFAALFALSILFAAYSYGDTLEMADGTFMKGVYVRDEGSRLLVWDSKEKVGSMDFKIIPRNLTKGGNPIYEQREDWDVHPQLPDLSVAFIEMNPKRAGLHQKIQYDQYGSPTIGGAPALDKRAQELSEKDRYMKPEAIVQDIRTAYKVGEEITFTAHVMNFGFVDAQPFEYRWLIDDKEVEKGKYDKPIKELGEVKFDRKYKWEDGMHTIGFEIVTTQKEIATINNKVTDAMWGFGVLYTINKKRSEGWHLRRSFYGTFSFEDYYRWHLEIMNVLFQASVYPSSPQGAKARMRLDNIKYLDDVNNETAAKAQIDPDGIGYYQAYWTWTDFDEERQTGWTKIVPTQGTEWSLPHELGHQLGFIDFYGLDYAGDDNHLWPDNKEKVCHLNYHPITMMAWHGPHLYNEVDINYINVSWNKPRGHYGDYCFSTPDESFLRVNDMNGRGVSGAKIEIFQRAATIDPKGKPQIDHGVTWYPIIDEDFNSANLSKDPVIVGTTDDDGVMRLPNRSVKEVITLNGFHRRPNPFGNINVVGSRSLMLIQVTKDNNPAFYWFDISELNIGVARGQKEKFTKVLNSPYGSVDSPAPPLNVKWEYADETKQKIKVTWDTPQVRSQHRLDLFTAFTIYRRNGPMGLNDRPWYAVGTVNSSAREFIFDLNSAKTDEMGYYSDTLRIGVTSVGEQGMQSGIVQATEAVKKIAQ